MYVRTYVRTYIRRYVTIYTIMAVVMLSISHSTVYIVIVQCFDHKKLHQVQNILTSLLPFRAVAMSLYRINMHHAVSVDLLMCLSLWCPVQEEERREVALLQAQLDAVRNVSTWSVADTIVCTNCVGVWLGVSVHKLSRVSGVRAFRVAPGTYVHVCLLLL